MPHDIDRIKQADPRGAYYTPASIVALIVENTIGRLCDEAASDSAPLRILDPACGDGGFLVGAYSYLLQRRDPHDRRQLLLDSVHGVDIDSSALDIAVQRLHETSGEEGAIDLSANLKHGDSLLDSSFQDGDRPSGIDWHREFPSVMDRGGFDAVIGNPPWVSLTGRFGISEYSEAEIAYLTRRFSGSSYMPNIFEYFVRLGFELTRPGGYFSFIVPDRLGFNNQLRGLRSYLLTEAELVTLVRDVRFPGVVADAMVFVFKKQRPRSSSRIHVSDYGQSGFAYPQKRLLDSQDCAFRIPRNTKVARVLERMETLPGRVPLSDICDSVSGFGGRSRLVTEERVSDAQIPVLKGSSIGRYSVGKRYWFDFRRENLTGRTLDREKLGASPKVLIRKTGSSLIAAYDDCGTYPEQSLYFLHNSRMGLDLRFVLGVLNSRLMGFYYQSSCLTNRQSIAHIKKIDLDRIPLPPVDHERHDQMVSLVQEMILLSRQLQSSDHKALSLEMESVDRAIDDIVFELYQIDSQDIED